MKRTPISRRYLAGSLLVLVVAAVTLSCGKDSGLVKPSGTANRSGNASGAPPFPSNGTFVPTDAVVVLQPNVDIADFADMHEVDLLASLELPQAGTFPERTYYLVRSKDEKPIDFTDFGEGALWVNQHNRIWIPEDDRGGLSFDDDQTWRQGGDYFDQPSINRLAIPAAHAISKGSGETIAILDTGIDAGHRLFQGGPKIDPGLNFTVFPPDGAIEDTGNGANEDDPDETDPENNPDDGTGHGTHVAGIVLAGAPDATLLIYKVLDDEGRGTVFGLAMAARYAADKGARVINLSLGLHVDDPLLRHALQHCTDKGVAVVASAGNRGTSEIQYPAGYDFVHSVAAVDDDDVRPNFASYGSTVDASAPGVDVVGPIPAFYGTDLYAIASGSSMSTAFFSAAVAVARSRWTSSAPVDAADHVAANGVDISALNPGYALGERVNFLLPLQTAAP